MHNVENLKQTTYFHGSDLEKIEQVYGIKKEEIISFSANVNPLGISYRLKKELINHIDAITTYPDREYTSLRTAIASYVHDDFHHIIVGNGSTELISLVIQCIHPKSALLLGPTYSEYAHELRLSGSTFRYFNLKEENDFTFVENDFGIDCFQEKWRNYKNRRENICPFLGHRCEKRNFVGGSRPSWLDSVAPHISELYYHWAKKKYSRTECAVRCFQAQRQRFWTETR